MNIETLFYNPLFVGIISALASSFLTAIFVHRKNLQLEKEKRNYTRNDFIKNIKEELLINIEILGRIENRLNNGSMLILYNIRLLEELLINDSISTDRNFRSYLNDRIISKEILKYINLKHNFINGTKYDLNLLFKAYGSMSDVKLSTGYLELPLTPEERKNCQEKLLWSSLDSRKKDINKIIESAKIILEHFEK